MKRIHVVPWQCVAVSVGSLMSYQTPHNEGEHGSSDLLRLFSTAYFIYILTCAVKIFTLTCRLKKANTIFDCTTKGFAAAQSISLYIRIFPAENDDHCNMSESLHQSWDRCRRQ